MCDSCGGEEFPEEITAILTEMAESEEILRTMTEFVFDFDKVFVTYDFCSH